ncbi:hypothetical protein E2562_011276 [Oryza meyeriana var. granulata]|uniref:Uncharacterized protein n=1 Tax=Oryza meyeriana var. granulata TaxID=110450 RepID=A0A6G1BW09_9ORYZ|nr:hypothetical protein E2562_011276 [Oryza meyeriana var. granulata]
MDVVGTLLRKHGSSFDDDEGGERGWEEQRRPLKRGKRGGWWSSALVSTSSLATQGCGRRRQIWQREDVDDEVMLRRLRTRQPEKGREEAGDREKRRHGDTVN